MKLVDNDPCGHYDDDNVCQVHGHKETAEQPRQRGDHSDDVDDDADVDVDGGDDVDGDK